MWGRYFLAQLHLTRDGRVDHVADDEEDEAERDRDHHRRRPLDHQGCVVRPALKRECEREEKPRVERAGEK